jgi:hypothetical protein
MTLMQALLHLHKSPELTPEEQRLILCWISILVERPDHGSASVDVPQLVWDLVYLGVRKDIAFRADELIEEKAASPMTGFLLRIRSSVTTVTTRFLMWCTALFVRKS